MEVWVVTVINADCEVVANEFFATEENAINYEKNVKKKNPTYKTFYKKGDLKLFVKEYI